MLEAFGINLTKEEAIDKMMKDWAPGQVTMFQHVAGAMLCVPSVFRLGEPSWATSLAVCGILSELGFDVYSTVEILYKRFCTEGGEKKVPNGMLLYVASHHCLTMVMAIPMLYCYRNLRALHW